MNCKSGLNVKGSFAKIVLCIAFAVSMEAQSGQREIYANIAEGGALSVVAEVHAKPGKADELHATTLPLVALVRSDPKNLVYCFSRGLRCSGSMRSLPLKLTSRRTKLPALAYGGVKTVTKEVLQAPRK